MAHTTIKDIAKKTEFSVATVSRVLSGSSYPTSREAKRIIEQTAREMGYVPNILARSLKTNASEEVAVIIPSIMNLFYSYMVMGIEASLSSHGYSMLIYLMNEHSDRGSILNSIRGKRISGVIIAADCISEDMVAQFVTLRKERIPVVVADYKPSIMDSFHGVFFDYRIGGQMAAEYLLRLRHKKIAYLTMTIDRSSRANLRQGFYETLQNAGEPAALEDTFISANSSEFEAGKELVSMMLDSGRTYTAAIANNDIVAVGALIELSRRGVRVPEEMSVMGFDDSIFAQMSSPTLTTVRVDAEAIGKQAGEFVLLERDGKPIENSVYLKPVVIERQSAMAYKA